MNNVVVAKNPGLAPSLPEPALRLLTEVWPQEAVRLANGSVWLRPAEPSPDARAVLEQARGILVQRLSPSQKAVLVTALARIANHHARERAPAQWQLLYEDFWEDLLEFSNAHITEAIRDHRRSSNWFPHIAELRSRCMSLRETDQIRLRRVNAALDIKAIPEIPPDQPDQRAADVGSRLRDLARKLGLGNRRSPAGASADPVSAGPAPNRDRVLSGRDPAAVAKLHELRPIEKKA